MFCRNFLKENRYYVLLLLIVCISYWPVSFHLFSLKNDALVYFLPYRFHISDTIQNGQFPWWNPFLYTGMPVHSDIQSGSWNPVVLFISLFTRYNMTVLQCEVLVYLFLAAAGMFKLLVYFGYEKKACLAAATAYVCCGFMTDSGSLIPWITSAAYLPWVFLYFLRLLDKPTLREAAGLGIACFLLLTAGYPSFFIVSCYIMGAGFLLRLAARRKEKGYLLLLLKTGIAAVLISLILSMPALLSWYEFLSYYDRGSGTSMAGSQENAFPFFGIISYFLSAAVSKNHAWLTSDTATRNSYTSLFIFLLFMLSLFRQTDANGRFIKGIILFTFLFSLGPLTPVREWSFRLLPLLDVFRHPSSIRLFTIAGILILGAGILSELIKGNHPLNRQTAWSGYLTIILLSAFLLLNIPAAHFSWLAYSGKAMLDAISFADMSVLLVVLQLFFLLAFLFFLYRKWWHWLITCIMVNSIVLCWISLPFTFISQTSPARINAKLKKVPHKVNLIQLQQESVQTGDTIPRPLEEFGVASFYYRQVRIEDRIITPTIQTNYGLFLKDLPLRIALNGMPFAYLSDTDAGDTNSLPVSKKLSPGGQVSLASFSANEFLFTIQLQDSASLSVFQQYHHKWKATGLNRALPVLRTNHSFMRIPLLPGNYQLRLHYSPGVLIRGAALLSLLTLLFLFISYILYCIKNRKYNEPQ